MNERGMVSLRGAPRRAVSQALVTSAALAPLTIAAVWLLAGLVGGKAGRGFGTLEGLQLAPLFAWGLMLVWVLYRPLLNAPAAVEGIPPMNETWFGWSVKWAPLLVPWAFPAIFATTVPVTAAVCLAGVAAEVCVLEWIWRRRRPRRPVDETIDRYRVRWDTGLFVSALVVGGVVLAVRDGGDLIVDIATVGGMLAIIALYMRVYDGFQNDPDLPGRLGVGGLASAVFALGPLAGTKLAETRPILAGVVSTGGAAAFIASTEWHRRAAIRWHRQQARRRPVERRASRE